MSYNTFQEKYIAVVPSLHISKWEVTLSPTSASNITRQATPTCPLTPVPCPFHWAVWPPMDNEGPNIGWGTTSAMFARGSLGMDRPKKQWQYSPESVKASLLDRTPWTRRALKSMKKQCLYNVFSKKAYSMLISLGSFDLWAVWLHL